MSVSGYLVKISRNAKNFSKAFNKTSLFIFDLSPLSEFLFFFVGMACEPMVTAVHTSRGGGAL